MTEVVGHADEPNIELTYDLLRQMLTYTPAQRPSAAALLEHPAFQALGFVAPAVVLPPAPFVPLGDEHRTVQEWRDLVLALITQVSARLGH
jgi:serine/threonine protein kinase